MAGALKQRAGRIAVDAAAENRVSAGNAVVDDSLRADRRDRALQLDVPPIERRVESGQDAGLQDYPECAGGRGLSLQARVTAGDRIVFEEAVDAGDVSVLRR